MQLDTILGRMIMMTVTYSVLCVTNYRQLGKGVCGATCIWPHFILQWLKQLCATHLCPDSWIRSNGFAAQVCR